MFGFVDGHCDTIIGLMDNNKELYKNDLHIDIERLKKFGTPTQIFAIWLNEERLLTPYNSTVQAIKFYKNELKKNKEFISHCNNFEDIKNNIQNGKISSLLALEGAEALENNIDNLHSFHNQGVKSLTLTWNNENCAGYGVGSNINKGLKPFGLELVKEMNNLNMLIDISHLNEKGFWDVYKNSTKPFFASHSNSFSMCNHVRNLNDDQLKAIKEVGGVVGLNLHVPFLNTDENRDSGIEYILRHIDYMLELMGEDNIVFGCDLDGTNYLPYDVPNVSRLKYIKHWIEVYFGQEIANKIAYDNYLKFLEKNL